MARRHLLRVLGIVVMPYLLLALAAAFMVAVVVFVER
jgi:hypothetical protein